MFDAITVGSATVDVFLDRKARERKGYIEYPAGAKIMVDNIEFRAGGCGVNVALGLSKLGFSVGYLGKLGNDGNAELVKEALKAAWVSFIGPAGQGKTGFSVVLDSIRRDRTILHYRGANDFLRPREVDKAKLDARWFYFGSALEKTLETQKLLARFAGRNGIKIALNPGITQCKMGAGSIGGLLKAAELLILNMEEASVLAGKRKPVEILKALKKAGPRIVCVTNGSRGTLCHDGGFVYELKPHNIKVTESTGAGDAFSSGMVAGLMRGRGTEHSLRLGLANAESVITARGASHRLLTRAEAERRARRPGRLTKRKI